MPVNIALVFVGGVLGVLAREALTLVVSASVFAAPALAGSTLADATLAGRPLAVFAANVIGAFLLGLLLESVTRERIRLLLGTGLLGGFTTYSALALAVVTLTGEGSVGLAIAYGLGTVFVGAIATWLGVMAGVRIGGGGSGGRRADNTGSASSGGSDTGAERV